MGDAPPSEAPASKFESGYWDAKWDRSRIPRPIDPRDRRLGNHVQRALHRHLATVLGDLSGTGASLIEIGCARSAWLPYFHREHGFRVSGLDASERGCEMARASLESAGVEGTIWHGDLFDPPAELAGAFDVVVSFGVVEHFDDTAGCLAACARLLAPGGRMVTLVPNMLGLLGRLQRVVDRAVYDIHVPLDAASLADAHGRAGLAVRSCEYACFINNDALVFDGVGGPRRRKLLRRAAAASSRVFWLLEDAGLPLRPNARTSPYVICVAERGA